MLITLSFLKLIKVLRPSISLQLRIDMSSEVNRTYDDDDGDDDDRD